MTARGSHTLCRAALLSALPLWAMAQEAARTATDPSAADFWQFVSGMPPAVALTLFAAWQMWGSKLVKLLNNMPDGADLKSAIEAGQKFAEAAKSEVDARLTRMENDLRPVVKLVADLEQQRVSVEAIRQQLPELAEKVNRVDRDISEVKQMVAAWPTGGAH